ncbi:MULTISPECIES: DUF932 domain-containing protein [Actinosynnema]|uniref:DUF932 domain-containing protein n=1 Tax=Actinosynnema TaxID=40566 RepID=UPI0020A61349|nr:DUF932 domain-containing protein [Actinosynnema pretiosum]MCP2092677.1 protein of unknown function (DUF932) [Actinosynnema pretiosum]
MTEPKVPAAESVQAAQESAEPSSAKAPAKAPTKAAKAAPAKTAAKGETKAEQQPSTVGNRDAWARLATANNSSRTIPELLKKAGIAGWTVTANPMVAVIPSGKCTECRKPVGVKHTADCLMGQELPAASGAAGKVEVEHTSIPLEVPGLWSLVKMNPQDPAKSVHIAHTNREATPVSVDVRGAILSELLKVLPGAKTGAAGPLWEGTASFATVRVPDLVSVGKVDKVEIRAVLVNSLMPGKGSTVRVMPVHTGTHTVIPVTLPGLPDRVELDPNNNQDSRITEASQALDLCFRMAEEFGEVANKLLRKKMTIREFQDFADTVLNDKPMPSAGPSQFKLYDTRTGVVEALFRGEVDLTAKIKGTRWAALLSVLAWVQNIKPTKTGGELGDRDRAMSALFPHRESLNTAQTALNLLTADL